MNIGRMLTSPVCPIHSVDPQFVQRYRGLLLFRQYYLEGGWGYVVLLASFLTVLITSGLQMSMGMISTDLMRRFKVESEIDGSTGKTIEIIANASRKDVL